MNDIRCWDTSDYVLAYYIKRIVKRSESMKKKNILIAIISMLIVVVFAINNTYLNTMAKQVEDESQEILYQDFIITALAPTINKAISDYYKNILTYSPGYSSRFIKILDIERPNGNRTSYFIIQIEVQPYVGPHITVGKDRLSIELSSPGTQVLKSFEHLEDHPLPEHYQDIYIK